MDPQNELAASPRVFVSFATNDGIHRHVLMRLNAQPLTVWDFQSVSMSIPIGSSIQEACFGQIDQADLFAILVTEQALNSPWVLREVEYALERSENGRPVIWPIVDKHLTEKQLEHPLLQLLSDIKGCHVDPTQPETIEDVVGQICTRLGSAPRAPDFEDPRLPFTKRLYEELRNCIAPTPYGSDVYQRAMRLVFEFHEAFKQDRFERAYVLSSYLVAMLRHEYPDASVYYPTIVQVISLCHLKRYDEALRELSALDARLRRTAKPGAPYPDDNLPGSLGYVYFERGDFEAARDEYRKAVLLNPDDAANYMSHLVLRIQCGEDLDVDALNQELQKVRRNKLLPGDDLQIEVSAAFAFAAANHREEALRRYAEIVEPRLLGNGITKSANLSQGAADDYAKHPLADAVVQYANLIVDSGRPAPVASLVKARRILESWLDLVPNHAHSLVVLGNLCIDLGDLGSAIGYFERLERVSGIDWQFRYEAMRGLWQAGAQTRSCKAARDILSGTVLGLPKERHQFFITGAANWILGEPMRADYDFERSGKPRDWHYAKYLHR